MSWQAPDTLGRRLAEQASEVRIFGETFQRKAEVVTIGGLSAHAGQDFLLEYARAVKGQVKRIILVHGEETAAEALRGKMVEQGLGEVDYPELYDVMEV